MDDLSVCATLEIAEGGRAKKWRRRRGYRDHEAPQSEKKKLTIQMKTADK